MSLGICLGPGWKDDRKVRIPKALAKRYFPMQKAWIALVVLGVK